MASHNCYTKRIVVSWSSGKDSAWAVTRLREDPAFEVIGLFTIFSAHQRVFMHAVRPEIVRAQARRIGVPLHEVTLPRGCSHAHYEGQMRTLFANLRAEGASHIGFGDLYLEEVQRHRLELLSGTGLEPVFPLWQKDTHRLAEEMIAGGLETYVTCTNLEQLDRSFVGRRWDRAMITNFPPGIDPCGEQGEFHTCVVAGPMFSEPLDFTLGEIVEREGYAFADLRLG